MKVSDMDDSEKCQEVRKWVFAQCTDWTDEEREFCDDPCIGRYLYSTKYDPKSAGKMLLRTLMWRRSFRVAELRDPTDVMSELRIGTLYVAGHTSKGQPILMSRCRKERPEPHMLPLIMRCFVYTAECAVRSLRNGQQQWITVMDLGGYTTASQPPLKATADTMRILMDHYPERMTRLFIVDAPTVFWLFFKAVSPFIDPSTRDKIQFVYTKKLLASSTGGGRGPALPADTPEARFAEDCLAAYQTPFDEVAYMAMLRELKMTAATAAKPIAGKEQVEAALLTGIAAGQEEAALKEGAPDAVAITACAAAAEDDGKVLEAAEQLGTAQAVTVVA